jgi:hypothetical protein
MKITADLFEAYLKCPTKCWLRSTGETSASNTYSEWVKVRNDSYRVNGTRQLVAESPNHEVVLFSDMRCGKIVHADAHATQTVKTSALAEPQTKSSPRAPC